MRLLVLGFLGPYPERLTTFVEDGQQVWYVSTLPPATVPGLHTQSYWDLATQRENQDGIAQLIDLIKREKIDLVYSLLNVWDNSAGITASLLSRGCPVPLVRHYKEHYMAPRDDERLSIELAAGAIFINREAHDYFAALYKLPQHVACMDADLLHRRYLNGELRPKLSAIDPERRPHTLIAGTVTEDNGRYDYRDLARDLIASGAHVHIYGQFKRMFPDGFLLPDEQVATAYAAIDAKYLHIHPTITPDQFVSEWSQYDAGMLHTPRPNDLFSAQNFPNRYSAYIAAGVPVALARGKMPAMQRHLEELGAAIVFDTPADLVAQLPNQAIADQTFASREGETFEAIYPNLISFLQNVKG